MERQRRFLRRKQKILHDDKRTRTERDIGTDIATTVYGHWRKKKPKPRPKKKRIDENHKGKSVDFKEVVG